VLTLTLGGAAVAYAAQALASSPWDLFVFRAASGFFTGGMLPPLYSIVVRSTPQERLGGIMGLTSSAIMLGSVIGPLAGGFLSAAIGIRWVFVASAAVLAISALGVRGLGPGAQAPQDSA
jgi:MFS family permease